MRAWEGQFAKSIDGVLVLVEKENALIGDGRGLTRSM
jgi:hypothetical protein